MECVAPKKDTANKATGRRMWPYFEDFQPERRIVEMLTKGATDIQPLLDDFIKNATLSGIRQPALRAVGQAIRDTQEFISKAMDRLNSLHYVFGQPSQQMVDQLAEVLTQEFNQAIARLNNSAPPLVQTSGKGPSIDASNRPAAPPPSGSWMNDRFQHNTGGWFFEQKILFQVPWVEIVQSQWEPGDEARATRETKRYCLNHLSYDAMKADGARSFNPYSLQLSFDFDLRFQTPEKRDQARLAFLDYMQTKQPTSMQELVRFNTECDR
jgi:hypothetical protein